MSRLQEVRNKITNVLEPVLEVPHVDQISQLEWPLFHDESIVNTKFIYNYNNNVYYHIDITMYNATVIFVHLITKFQIKNFLFLLTLINIKI